MPTLHLVDYGITIKHMVKVFVFFSSWVIISVRMEFAAIKILTKGLPLSYLNSILQYMGVDKEKVV